MEADGRPAEPEAIDLIARLAAGGMRDAESMLDQLLSVDTGTLTAERVRDVLGLVDEETIERFLRCPGRAATPWRGSSYSTSSRTAAATCGPSPTRRSSGCARPWWRRWVAGPQPDSRPPGR